MIKRTAAVFLAFLIFVSLISVQVPAFASETRQIASVTGGGLKLRDKASTNGETLGTYVSGTLVNVLKQTNKNWYQVEVNGKSGYMMSKYLTIVNDYEHIAWAEAGREDDIVNLYDIPGGKISFKTYGKCLLEVVGEEGDWVKVRSGQQFYYIPRSSLAYTEAEYTIAGYMGSGNEFATSVGAMNTGIHDVGSQKSLTAASGQLQCEIQYPVFILGKTDAAISGWVHELLTRVNADMTQFHPDAQGSLKVYYNTRKLDDRTVCVILFGEYRADTVTMPFYKAFTVDTVNDMILTGQDLVGEEYRDKVLSQLACKIMRLFNEYSGGYDIPLDTDVFSNAALDQNGLTFYFAPGRILPLSYGFQKVTLPYLQSGTYLTYDSAVVNDNKRNIDPTKPMIALTFDDGPGEYTYQILDALETYGGRATFCVVGTRLSEFSNVIKSIVAQENEVACHTWGHKKLIDLSSDNIKKQITRVNEKVREIADYDIKVLRPPYGSTNARVRNACANLGMTIAFWTVDTEDWITKNANTTYDRILQGAGTGVIVLCHDIYEPTAEAAVRVIPELIQRGYQLVTMSELLSFHKDGPIPGTVYTRVDPDNIISSARDQD